MKFKQVWDSDTGKQKIVWQTEGTQLHKDHVGEEMVDGEIIDGAVLGKV